MTQTLDASADVVQENPLVTAIRSTVGAGDALHILNHREALWFRRQWSDILAAAEAVGHRLESFRQHDEPRPVAVIGEASFELIAVVVGAWMAGRASTILAGPNRLMSLDAWSGQIEEKMSTLGVGEVFSQGSAFTALRKRLHGDRGVSLINLSSVEQWPAAPATFRPVRRMASEPVILQGTAGSTGAPKFVELTASATLTQIRAVLDRQQYRPGDALCSWLPLFHDLGLTMLLAGMITGAPTWIAPTSAFAKAPSQWLDWLHVSRATVTAGPNFAYALLGRYAKKANGVDLGALRVAINGGELIDVEATEQFVVKLAPSGFSAQAVCCSYGLAEASCGLTMPHASSGMDVDEFDIHGVPYRMARLGPPMDGVEIRIVDSDYRTDHDAYREVGEIEFRARSQMRGYVGERAIQPGEWIQTGDLGYFVDDDLVVCGRSKELITIGGRNIFPQDVERVVSSVPGLRPGAVAAVSGNGNQFRRDQLIVVAEYQGNDADAVREAIVERLGEQCGITPKAVEFVDRLPKTTSGKLRRVEISARYR